MSYCLLEREKWKVKGFVYYKIAVWILHKELINDPFIINTCQKAAKALDHLLTKDIIQLAIEVIMVPF